MNKRLVVFLLLALLLPGCSLLSMAQDLLTQASEPLPTATYISGTNTPLPTMQLFTGDPDVVLEEKFSYNDRNWWVGEDQNSRAEIKDGEYLFTGFKSDLMNWSTYGEKKYTDAVMNVKFRILSGGEGRGVGVVFFWRVVDDNNMYFWEVSASGDYFIGKYVENEIVPIVELAKSDALLPAGELNKATLVFHGNEFEFYLNDHFETSFSDDAFSSGQIGLGVSTTADAGVEAAFDELDLYRYNQANAYTPQKPLLTPTPQPRLVTWNELADFLVRDHTNWHEYDLEDYNCLDFAIDLVANARSENMKAWIVGVDFVNGDTGHAFVAFETSDRGTVFVEPQRDYTYSTLKVGSDLCDDWGQDACWGVVESIEYMGYCTHDQYCTEYVP